TAYFDDAAFGVVSLEEIRQQLLEKVGSVQDELEAVSSHIRSGSVAEDQAIRNQSEELADELGMIEDQGELAVDASVLGNLIVETGSISLRIKRLNNFVEARNARPEAPFGLVKADAMELVYPKEIPCQCSTDPAQLSLAQGEYESIQAVVMPYGESLHNMSAQITSVVGPDGAEVSDSMLRASVAPLGSVYVRKSNFYILPALEDRPTAYEGWIPDPIRTDLPRVDVAALDMQPFWIELYASDQAKPGTYRVSVSFSADGTDTEVMEIDAVVWPFKIQDRPELATSMTMNPIQLKTVYGLTDGAEFDQMHEKYIDFLETFKIEPDLIYTQTPPSVEDLLKIKNKWGLRQFNFYYIYPGWLNLDINNPATWQPEIDRIVQEIGSALKMYEDAGLAEYGYIYGFDESRGAQLLLAKEIFTQIKQHFPNLPIMSTLIDSTLGAQSGLAGLIDIWVPSVDGFNQTAQAEAQNRGDQVYWYTHAGVQSPYPNWFNGYAPSDTRILLGPMSHKMDVDGFLYYNITRWPNRGPMQDGVLSNWDARTWNDANGDGSLFYPGQNGPLASQRIQNFRDGMEDYNLLNMLQTYMERASGVSESVLSAAQSLLKADTVVTSKSVYTKDPSVYRQWRDAVANMIEQLDTAAPKWPDGGKLSVTEATYSSIALQWPSATDDQAVEEYRIYVDGIEHPHPIQSDGRDNYPFTVSGLTDGTTYTFSVKAVDEVGHTSEVMHLSASTPSNINLVEARLESHIASGNIKQPLASQLTNHFKQAVKHLEEGQMPQAIHSLEVFLEHLGSEAHADRINPQVKAALQSNVQILKTQWQE
ncbi:MAG: hypothetical protein K0Q81_1578, partial [Paenibacillus sp.]|nr:hypothetical protein [Paenibacillus sp.]